MKTFGGGGGRANRAGGTQRGGEEAAGRWAKGEKAIGNREVRTSQATEPKRRQIGTATTAHHRVAAAAANCRSKYAERNTTTVDASQTLLRRALRFFFPP